MILLPFLYTLLAVFFIRRVSFFRLEGLGTWTPSLFFLLKVVAGTALWALYTYHYSDSTNADIYKYFSDSEIMFNALDQHPGDYFRMLFGIGNDTPYFDTHYYQVMDHWYREFDSNLYNDSHTIIRFNAFVRLFSYGNYHVHTVMMCLLSFTGLCGLYKVFYPLLRQWSRIPGWIIFLFPSVLFWSSGVLKEGFLFFGLGLLLYHFFRMLHENQWWRLLPVAACGLLLFVTKFYLLVAVVPALLGMLLVHFTGKRLQVLKYGLVLVFYAAAGLLTDKIFPGYNPFEVLAIKQHDMLNLARGGTYLLSDTTVNIEKAWIAYLPAEKRAEVIPDRDSGFYHIREGNTFTTWNVMNLGDTLLVTSSRDTTRYTILSDFPKAGSLLNVKPLEPTFADVALHTPQAIWNTLARPYPWESNGLFLLVAALENLLLLGVLLFCILHASRISPERMNLFLFSLVFVLVLFSITGLTSPVMGALTRYRIPGLPFLLFAALLLCDIEKVKKRFPKLGNYLNGKSVEH